MNAYEQLVDIRDRLEQNGASEDSIELVEKFIKRAESEKYSTTSVPQMMMLRHLIKQREALDNFDIYNDLQELMTEHEARRTNRDAEMRPEYEERAPRPHSYYKALKDKQRESR